MITATHDIAKEALSPNLLSYTILDETTLFSYHLSSNLGHVVTGSRRGPRVRASCVRPRHGARQIFRARCRASLAWQWHASVSVADSYRRPLAVYTLTPLSAGVTLIYDVLRQKRALVSRRGDCRGVESPATADAAAPDDCISKRQDSKALFPVFSRDTMASLEALNSAWLFRSVTEAFDSVGGWHHHNGEHFKSQYICANERTTVALIFLCHAFSSSVMAYSCARFSGRRVAKVLNELRCRFPQHAVSKSTVIAWCSAKDGIGRYVIQEIQAFFGMASRFKGRGAAWEISLGIQNWGKGVDGSDRIPGLYIPILRKGTLWEQAIF